MTKLRVFMVAALAVAVAACGDDGDDGTGGNGAGGDTASTGTATSTSASTSTGAGGDAPVCPDGLDDTEQSEPAFSQCPDGADPSGEACCSLDEVHCVNLELPDEGGNIYTKVLFSCEGETWGAGATLDRCAGDLDDLESLDGSPCSDEEPCDITTGDLDARVAICFDGTWFVYGNGG